MSKNKLFMAKCVIETTSALAIHSGGRELGSDTQLARDWNLLPYVPSSSLVGVWRSALRSSNVFSVAKIASWFGSEKKGGTASRLSVSDALMLSSKLNYYPFLVGSDVLRDQLYATYGEDRSETRDRCRISHRSVAEQEGKFDVAVLPAGIRFVFDLQSLVNNRDDDGETDLTELRIMLSLFAGDGISLGSGVTNGQGRVKLLGYTEKVLDLEGADARKLTDEIKKFRSENNVPLTIGASLQTDIKPLTLLAKLNMKARDYWRIGSVVADKKTCCYKEKFVSWGSGKVEFQDKVVVLGSTLKGIIAHRTDYHFRKLKYLSAGGEPCNSILPDVSVPISPELQELFGTAGDKANKAKAGQLIVKDTVINQNDFQVDPRTHVKIDYFSGGAFDKALFNEERIYQPRMSFEIYLKDKITNPLVAQALYRTLIDIKEGFLPISSGSGRQAGLLDYQDNGSIFNAELLQGGVGA